MADGTAPPSAQREYATEGEMPAGRDTRRPSVDLFLAAGVTVVAAAAMALPGGPARAVITLPMVLFVPGYLLVQAVAWEGPKTRLYQAMVAVGLSPPLVALLAMATAIVPGGFKPLPIVLTITVACIAMAVVAYVRRRPVAA